MGFVIVLFFDFCVVFVFFKGTFANDVLFCFHKGVFIWIERDEECQCDLIKENRNKPDTLGAAVI